MTDEEPNNPSAAVLGLAAIEDRYGDDHYGRTDDWVEGLPDLGENA
jgi:hypothetical protein